jgi:hypothetical protein
VKHVLAQYRREAAGVHRSPERFDHGLEVVEIVLEGGAEVGKAVLTEKVDVFGEDGEDTAHGEWGYGGGGVILFQRAREVGEMPSVTGDAGGDAAGIEGQRVEPDGAEAIANGLKFELVEGDAVGEGVGKRNVGFAGAGKVGEELDGMADVDDDEEGRPAFGGGKGFRVLLGLVAGAEHGFVPAGSAANTGASSMRQFEEEAGLGRGAALLGFEDEATFLIEIDAAGAGEAGRVAEGNGVFEDVVVGGVVGESGVGAGNFEEVW